MVSISPTSCLLPLQTFSTSKEATLLVLSRLGGLHLSMRQKAFLVGGPKTDSHLVGFELA